MAELADSNGVPGVPAGPMTFRRRCAALLLATLLLPTLLLPGVLLQLPGATEAHAQPSGSRSVDVSIDFLSPSVPSRGDTLKIAGKVRNRTDSRISDPRVALRLSGPFTSRSAIADAARRKGYDPGSDGTEIDGRGTREIPDLARGAEREFHLDIPVNRLPLDQPGVYQLAVSVSGTSAAVGYEQVLGIERSFLPWQPADLGTKTRVTFVWPLTATPRLTARTEGNDEQTPVLANDDLLKEMAPGGRLERLVSRGADLPVTWVVDPDLLATAAALADTYRVRTEDDRTVTRGGQEVAQNWLRDLQQAVKSREVVALPFGDTDLASIAHRGRKVTGTLEQLGNATRLSETTVDSLLHVKPVTDVAWPVEGAIDRSIVGVAGAAGADRILTRSDSMSDYELPYTPTAARPIGGGKTAVVADAHLSKLFEGDMARAENFTLGVQQFLAQTLMITLQQPANQRSIVVAPQRMPSLSQLEAMATALGELDSSTWMTALNLDDAAEQQPDPEANRTVPGRAAYPTRLRKQEIPVSSFESVKETQDALDNFSVILTDSLRVTVPFGNALLRELSNQWRGRNQQADEFRTDVQDYLDELTREVQLIDKSDLTLSGNSGTIPVTVQNNLVQDVQQLELRLTSGTPRRLDIENDRQLIEVAGGHSTSVKFEAVARASGPVTVTAQLYTPDGEPFGAPNHFQVEVTSITSTVLLVIGAGILLLVLAGVRMYTQRKRAAARADEEAGTEPDDPGADTAESRDDDERGPGAGESADGGAGADDTGAESGARSAASERVDPVRATGPHQGRA